MRRARPTGTALPACGLAAALLIAAAPLAAAPADEAAAIPQVGQAARDGYLSYRVSDPHRAFAIAPGGTWSWVAGQPSADAAGEAALAGCRERTPQPCLLYALDDSVVFDRARWPTLWRRFARDDGGRLREGRQPGQRMFDLRFTGRDGRRRRLSEWRGKVVLLHFWGSWCPPCLAELPQLLKLQRRIERDYAGRIELLLLQAREPIERSRAWAAERGFAALPLYDSGSSGAEPHQLRLAGDRTLPDRYLAPLFPTSYVIDRAGVVRFAHAGAIHDWLDYLPFLADTLDH